VALQLLKLLLKVFTLLGRLLDQVLALEDVDVGECGNAGDGMTAEGEQVAEGDLLALLLSEAGEDLVADGNAGNRR